MKIYTLVTAACVLLFLNSCKKNTSEPNNPIRGKWMQIGNYISIGGPGHYSNDAIKANYAEFNTNGTVSGTVFPDYNRYVLKDSVTITLTAADKATYENYTYQLKNDTLVMSPSFPNVCLEGCAIVFIKE